jgi:hypothetical protein
MGTAHLKKCKQLFENQHLLLLGDICGLYYKSFMIIIYDRNDNGQHYKTMIVANLALARSVNYDHKVCCKLKHTFMIVNYNPKPFIVQATAGQSSNLYLNAVHFFNTSVN